MWEPGGGGEASEPASIPGGGHQGLAKASVSSLLGEGRRVQQAPVSLQSLPCLGSAKLLKKSQKTQGARDQPRGL